MSLTKDPMSDCFKLGIEDRKTFDWRNATEVVEKVDEEIAELKESFLLKKTDQLHELGDVLFTLIQLARHLGIDPSVALELANLRYKNRTQKMKELIEQNSLNIESLGMEELTQYWNQAKLALKKSEKEQLIQFA